MNLDELKLQIEKDKAKTTSSYRRYPVRFLFMELNNNTQSEILDLVKSNNGELLELSDFIMKKDDGWLTKSRFIQVIKNEVSKTKDTFVVGFSEMIRFYSRKEIESTVLSLFDIENNNIMDPECSSRRIYFICFSMMDNVYKVLQNSFSRKDLIDPFLNADYELSGEYRQICFVSDEYADNIKKNKITTSVEWIGLWRHSEIIDFSYPIWCCSASLYEWHKKASPDNAFQIDSISNTKSYLGKVLGYEIDFIYQKAEDDFWKKLLEEFERVKGNNSLKQVIGSSLGVNIDYTYYLAGKYITTEDAYEKWLIKNYVTSYMSDSFFARVLNHLSAYTNNELLMTVWLQGYKISNAAMLKERLEIIKELNKYADAFIPEKEIKNEIVEGMANELSVSFSLLEKQDDIALIELSKQSGQPLDGMKSRLMAYYSGVFKPAYTGISTTEKEFLINLFANDVITDKDEIRLMYPALYAYLFGSGDNLILGKDEYKIYLDSYRRSKIKSEDTPYLKNYYSSGCANADNLYSMYYGMEKQDNLVQKVLDDESNVYVIDGVGAEYIPLLIELIKINKYDIELCDMATAHLPSITEVNKAYLSKINIKKWIVEFDRDVIHGEFYKSTNNTRKALDVLSRIIKDIISESYGKRIIITSDHGATARAKWTETKKKYDFTNSDHEGRCSKLLTGENYENTVDYIVYEDEINSGNKYVISLNETSLLNRPKYEDHGGATMEELLVPVVVAVPQGKKPKTIYKVIDEKLNVSGLDKLVRFSIIPNTDDAVVVDGDGNKHSLENVGGIYQAELTSGKEQSISVLIEDNVFSFKTVNNAKKNMEGDDGFDD